MSFLLLVHTWCYIIPVCTPSKDKLHVFITSRQAISSYVKTGKQTTGLDIAKERHTFKLQCFIGLSFVKLALNPSMKIDHYCTRFDCCKIVNHFLQVRACEDCSITKIPVIGDIAKILVWKGVNYDLQGHCSDIKLVLISFKRSILICIQSCNNLIFTCIQRPTYIMKIIFHQTLIIIISQMRYSVFVLYLDIKKQDTYFKSF